MDVIDKACEAHWSAAVSSYPSRPISEVERRCMTAALTALADNVSDEMVLVFGQVAAEGLATPEEVAKKFHESSEADKAHLRRAISAAIRAASQPTGEA